MYGVYGYLGVLAFIIGEYEANGVLGASVLTVLYGILLYGTIYTLVLTYGTGACWAHFAKNCHSPHPEIYVANLRKYALESSQHTGSGLRKYAPRPNHIISPYTLRLGVTPYCTTSVFSPRP